MELFPIGYHFQLKFGEFSPSSYSNRHKVLLPFVSVMYINYSDHIQGEGDATKYSLKQAGTELGQAKHRLRIVELQFFFKLLQLHFRLIHLLG